MLNNCSSVELPALSLMKRLFIGSVCVLSLLPALSLQAQVPNEYVAKMAEQTASMACRAEKQLNAYNTGYEEAIRCLSNKSKAECLSISREVDSKDFVAGFDLSSCSTAVKLSQSEIYIAPPVYKSELDARLASATIDQGIESVLLRQNESGGADLILISPDGRRRQTLHSENNYSDALKPIGGQFSERIVFLIDKDPDNKYAETLKKIILSILEENR
ncbi:hypothetical protein [Teredinibacter purpureus]|uniref:hypothetical protein n=1 Tax=Teredinibacter purpureus TaxID=2731756 RepID=UPI0005F88D52|nr:hypothetical protein [Teredinibacter purpureus]